MHDTHDGPGKAPGFGVFLKTVLANRPLLWVIAGGSLAGFGMTSISQFMAVFLARNYHLGVREAAAAFGGISGLSIAVGLLVGSFGTDYLSRRDPRWPAWGAACRAGLRAAALLVRLPRRRIVARHRLAVRRGLACCCSSARPRA